MDITNILKSIKDMKIIHKDKLSNKSELFIIEHSKHNLINVDYSDSQSSCESINEHIDEEAEINILNTNSNADDKSKMT